MAAPYVKRYGGGFLDLPAQTTPVDSAFLNAVEDALVRLLGVAPAVDTVGVWTPGGGNGALVYQKITNAQIAAAAAIDKSKLAALNIVDADVAAGAAIAKSKLAALNLVNADIAGGAAIAISKFAGYPTDGTKVLRGDGTWGAPTTTYRKTTAKAVNTTVAATDLLNGEITVAAGAMGTNKLLRLTAWGDWKNNSGANVAPPRIQLALGGTVLLDSGTSGGQALTSVTRYGWRIVAEIMNLGAANVQMANLDISLAAVVGLNGQADFATGEGIYILDTPSVRGFGIAEGYGPGAKDTSAALALELKVINGSANANYETNLVGALAEIV